MAWPFSVDPPSLDSGFVDVPAVLANLPDVAEGDQVWLMGANFANDTNGDLTVRLEDGSGGVLVPDVTVPSKASVPIEWAFLPATGLKWKASDTGVTGKVWGYIEPAST